MSMPLYACGSNGSGQLAIGTLDDVSIPTACKFDLSIPRQPGTDIPDVHICSVASAAHHALLLAEIDGKTRLLGVGTNSHGQLGQKCALREDGQVERWTSWRYIDLLPRELRQLDAEWQPTRIAITWTTSFVVYCRWDRSEDGRSPRASMEVLVACGSNDFGECGYTPVLPNPDDSDPEQDPDGGLPRIVDLGLVPGERVWDITGGQRHVLALISKSHGMEDSRIMGWGASRKGELDPHGSDQVSEKRSGKRAAQPRSSLPSTLNLPLAPGEIVEEVAAGASHSLALLSSGRVIGWGANNKGQIARLETISGAQSAHATWGGSYILCHSTPGSALRFAELGDNPWEPSPPSPTHLWSQGSNTHSQLLRPTAPDDVKLGSTDPSHPGPKRVYLPNGTIYQGREIDQVACGSEHVVVRLDDDTVLAGGWNEHGNLGVGDQEDRAGLVPVELPGGARAIRVWAGCAATWIRTRSEARELELQEFLNTLKDF